MIVFVLAVGVSRPGTGVRLPPRRSAEDGPGRGRRSLGRRPRSRHAACSGSERQNPRGVLQRISARLADEVAARGRDLTRMRQDLEIADTTLEAHLTRMLGLALAGFLGPLVIVSILFPAVGVQLPAVLGPLAGAGLGAAMVIVVRRELRDTATTRQS